MVCIGHDEGSAACSQAAAATAAMAASLALTGSPSLGSNVTSMVGVSTARRMPNERMVRSWIEPSSGSTARCSLRTSPSPMCAAPVQ
ncbi:MAG: hypothetical protein ACO3PD_02540 [Acidimicrobiales bacterium]